MIDSSKLINTHYSIDFIDPTTRDKLAQCIHLPFSESPNEITCHYSCKLFWSSAIMVTYQMEISPGQLKPIVFQIHREKKIIMLANSSKPGQGVRDIKEYRLNKIHF